MPQHPASSVHRHTLTGIGLTVLACACFSLLDTGAKYAGALLLLMAPWLRYAMQSLPGGALARAAAAGPRQPVV